MNALKIINIALLSLLIVLFINLFQPKQTTIPTNEISIAVTPNNVTIPSIPKVTVHNTTSDAFTINTCNDIRLTQNSQPVKIETFSTDFCRDVEFGANSHTELALSSLHKLFASKPANYILSLDTHTAGERNISFQVEAPGFFRNFLRTLIYNPIYNLFAGLIAFVTDYSLGWAIVIVTVIIRLILLYPQHRMLENTRKMASLNPKIRAIQKEYADDRATQGMKMMELYKQEKVSPMGSCLPLLIQFPILIALYWVIMGITDISNIYHRYDFLAAFNPTEINTFFFGQNLLQSGGVVAFVLAGILMLTQFLQSYLSIKAQPPLPKEEPKKDGDPAMPTLDPRVMQKMTLYVFPFMIGVSALFFPIGLGLYWWIGLLFMIVQQIFVNAQAEKQKQKGEIVTRK